VLGARPAFRVLRVVMLDDVEVSGPPAAGAM
jgi:hypothetical protein